MRKINFNTKKIIRNAFKIFGLYLLFVIIFGAFIFNYINPKTTDYEASVEKFYSEEKGTDRVVLLEDGYDALIARVNIIENAQNSIDVSYYTIHDGMTNDIFVGALIEAADRGVQVRYILDGFVNSINKDVKNTIMPLDQHPNIAIKYYEPISLIRPWTWNNILHDKYVITDNTYAIIGGRNIGDKYFLSEESYEGTLSKDRDILIVNTKVEDINSTVINDIKEYYESLFNHQFSSSPSLSNTKRKINAREQAMDKIRETYKDIKVEHTLFFDNDINWMAHSIPTNKMTLIHNPLQRLNKKPWVWMEITNLIEKANESVYVQSPYVIPTDRMLKYLNDDDININHMSIITNSIGVSPNLFAYSGYAINREKLVDYGFDVYEYQGPGSLHAKSIVIDSRVSIVGTFNIDSRSTFLSTESMIVIDSEALALELEKSILGIKNSSLLVDSNYQYIDNQEVEEQEASWIKRSVINILKPIAKIFDYLL
ncbi:putative cardiolipin synthase [Natranaerovirga hydrolytica]|uniref:Putative cardiolipin synthase n=1 Tax=Natranaerovirga hydrolytica TaxID=680378 RepID=A0A4R1MNB9_9FIRM|nr:phospholipase D family protein [Natranaerovirga hydrolytica]TCK92794.1 putative cardiolipin synthase [Natranaerovirga hydrolytica]